MVCLDSAILKLCIFEKLSQTLPPFSEKSSMLNDCNFVLMTEYLLKIDILSKYFLKFNELKKKEKIDRSSSIVANLLGYQSLNVTITIREGAFGGSQIRISRNKN